MKILWVNPNFLHPTTKGGQIRTLEMVKRLHRRHEVHYVAYENPSEPEGPARAKEYSTKWYPVQHAIPSKRSVAFAKQLAVNLASSMPLAVSRYHSPAMTSVINELIEKEKFDSIVCDFLFPAPNFPSLRNCVLFQHNVETIIWQRHFETAKGLPKRLLFRSQWARMQKYEEKACRESGYVVAVSLIDAERMRAMFGINNVCGIPTGVDTEYFAPPSHPEAKADLVFVGSMDWMPNIDGVNWFVNDILPLIRQERPDCTVAVVGRTPTPEIVALGERDSKLNITGTVPDVRPYLWGSKVCIVPLRVGGGTRLKIYEAMAAKTPVVSTTIGAEGLPLTAGEHIAIADTPESFAPECLRLLAKEDERKKLAEAAWNLVSSKFSWDSVTTEFERILEANPAR